MITDDTAELVWRAARRVDRPPLDASQLSTVLACPSSAALSAHRAWLEDDVRRVAVARAELADGQRESAVRRALARAVLSELQVDDLRTLAANARSWQWLAPIGSLANITLQLLEDGQLIMVPSTSHVKAENAIFSATCDVLWAEPCRLAEEGKGYRCLPGNTLVVGKYVMAEDPGRRPPVDDQELVASAVIAQHWTRSMRTEARIIGIAEDQGTVDGCFVPYVEPSPAVTRATEKRDIGWREFVARICGLVARVERARQQTAIGEPLDLCTGLHCLSCPVARRCPAWLAELSAVTGISLDDLARPPTHLVTALLVIERLKNRIASQLRSHVGRQGPIELGDGRLWGCVEHDYHLYDGRSALRTLESLVGVNCKFKISSTQLRDILLELREQAADELLAQLHETMTKNGDLVERRTLHRWRTYTIIGGQHVEDGKDPGQETQGPTEVAPRTLPEGGEKGA